MQNFLFSTSWRFVRKISTTSSRTTLRSISSSVTTSAPQSPCLSAMRTRSPSLTLNPFNPIPAHRFLSTSTNSKSSSSNAIDNSEISNNNNEITGHTVMIDGRPIHYERAGHGPHVLLLLPGAIGSGKTDFLPQLAGLNPELFTLIAWDPPGYGQSRPPDRDFEDFYRKDAKMAAKLMQTLHCYRYSVLGWSDGGITGLILAANQGRTCVSKLIIWGANSYVNEEDRAAVLKIRDPRTDWSPTFRQTFIDLYGEEYFYRLWDRFVAHYITLNDICREDLKHIKAPVLILHGDQDPMLAPEHPVYLVNNLDNATLYRFPKGKHNIHQKYAQEFNKLVEDFVTTK